MSADPPPFEIDKADVDGHLLLTLRGELDLASAPELEDAALPVIRDGGRVVIDLRGLEFIDSSGVRVLVAGHAAAQVSGGHVKVVRAVRESPVDRVIDIAGIADALDMVDEP
jgi:anti-sigma B factor antagonist